MCRYLNSDPPFQGGQGDSACRSRKLSRSRTGVTAILQGHVKATAASRGFLQAAQTIAIREYHQRLTPEHLLKALLDDEQGAASGLIAAAGGDSNAVRGAVEAELRKQPSVQGGRAEPQATAEFVRALDAAQQAATKAGDSFVA